eukprot:293752-Amphidinium_carterae.1
MPCSSSKVTCNIVGFIASEILWILVLGCSDENPPNPAHQVRTSGGICTLMGSLFDSLVMQPGKATMKMLAKTVIKLIKHPILHKPKPMHSDKMIDT